ncbi:UPF0182 family protein [Natroniella sulfidigena]|uniref:UPF0182 family membrane protein n=1 Tax=Natroniella sulfidigena TaxID=723921 RepID=UPI00200A611C|nr:UPF0182 family protein [Natroniella sulfidigena]MCK8817300.1 UPF0182 family protein [Natroniella sulfidigena]
MKKSFSFILFAFTLAIILSSNFLELIVNFYTDWLWFESLELASVFWTIFGTRLGLRLGLLILFTAITFVNLSFTKDKILSFINNLKKKMQKKEDVIELNPISSNNWLNLINSNRISLVYLVVSLLIGFLFSGVGTTSWQLVLKFINRTPFEIVDPIFSKDLSFYIFQLPVYELIYQMLTVLVILNLIIVGAIYLFIGTGNSKFKFSTNNKAKYHISILLSAFFFLKAWGYRLDMFDLLYSEAGVAFGASYTDVNAQLLALRILLIISLLLGIVTLINSYFKQTKLIIGGVGALILASILLNGIYPSLVQRYRVEPNELAMESPYIEHNIDFTQQAYNLDQIERRDYPLEEDISYNDLRNNQETIDNIRLWDHRALKDTYSQLQEIRSYYTFTDIDVDRYSIDENLQQVMLSARELDQDLLPERAQTWVNKRLVYTHGFGAAMSPANKVTSGGLPEFLIRDIPPQSDLFEITEPRIYYGEATNDYVIVNTEANEFDYPEGDQNKFYNYKGTGGVKLDSPVKRLAFAFKYRTLNMLLNDDLTTDSRLMFDRNIQDRVRKVAPFLRYDQDPYLVIGDDGNMYWIQDAYTTTDMYPYSEPHNWGNYIRNSVKVVINAYTGDMDFYIVDEEPIIETYQSIFPDLFKSFEEMPEGIKNHIRYPQDLFNVQAQLYSTYHMSNPNVFYNKEDVWNIPREHYDGSSIMMEPYYTVMSLPEEDEEDFILMLPFTPANRNNIISWLGAKSNPANYGELVLYDFPKGEQVYGPMQIESRIDQHEDISQQLSLWDQRGSRVIRGNLLVIPVGQSLLYVEPIFLQSEDDQIPELRRVIASFGDEIVMESTLELALLRLVGDEELKEELEDGLEDEPTKTREAFPEVDINLQEKISEVTSLYNEAQEELKDGNWQKYGELVTKLEEKLLQLEEELN